MLTSDARKGGGIVRLGGMVQWNSNTRRTSNYLLLDLFEFIMRNHLVFMGFTKSLLTCISNSHIYSRVYHLPKLLNRILYLNSLKLFLSNVNIYSFVITILHFSRHSFKFVFNW